MSTHKLWTLGLEDQQANHCDMVGLTDFVSADFVKDRVGCRPSLLCVKLTGDA